MDGLKAPPRKSLPEWLTSHFSSSLDSHEKLAQITRLSEQGIRMHLAVPNAIRALGKAKDEERDDKFEERVNRAENDAALAKREIDEEFPVLHGFVAVALWGCMEDFVKGLIAEWVRHRPSSMRAPEFQKLRIRWGDYVRLSKQEQALFMVELLEQEMASPLKHGINRFTSLLSVIDLCPEMSDETKKSIFELQKVRNNLAHRNGKIDRRLVSDCPWLDLKVGNQIMISGTTLWKYFNASGDFFLKILYDVGDTYNMDLRPTPST